MTDRVIAFAGQSLHAAMFTEMSGVAGGPPSPITGTHMWQQSTLSWVPPYGAGAIEYANMLKAATGDDIYLINAAIGGASLLQVACDPASPDNCWSNLAVDSPYSWLMGQVASCGKTPTRIEWDQGQAEYAYTAANPGYDMFTNYTAALQALQSRINSAWGSTPQFCISVSGKASYGYSQQIMRAQINVSTMLNFTLGPAYYDMYPQWSVDGTHLTGQGYRVKGDRMARNYLGQMGVTGFGGCGPGPQITSAWKGGSTVAIATNSSSGMTTYPGPGSLTGFMVWDYGYTRTYDIASAYLSSGLIFLSLTENPGDGNHVHIGYQFDNYQSSAKPVFDNQSVFVSGSPLIPCANPFETSN